MTEKLCAEDLARRPGLEAHPEGGCPAAPGFAFADFELAKRDKLSARFPHARKIIERLTDWRPARPSAILYKIMPIFTSKLTFGAECGWQL